MSKMGQILPDVSGCNGIDTTKEIVHIGIMRDMGYTLSSVVDRQAPENRACMAFLPATLHLNKR